MAETQDNNPPVVQTESFNPNLNVQEFLRKRPNKSILKKFKSQYESVSDQPRRMSTVQDQTTYNALAGKVENLDQILTSDQGVIDTKSDAHKKVVQDLARQVQEDAPRYAIRTVYNELLPCLKKINQHYHRIAVGASKEHPDLKDCDARLAWATEYVKQMNDLI